MATKAALISEIGTNFPDNTTGSITPAITRTTHTDEVNSWQQAPTVNAQTGTSYTVATTDYGLLVTLNNAAGVAVSLPASSAAGFNPFNVRFKNLGTGTVTVTPTAGNIDGLASISILTGASVQLVGDGTNYHAASVSPVVDPGVSAVAVGSTAPSGAAAGVFRGSSGGLGLQGLNIVNNTSGTAGASTFGAYNFINVSDGAKYHLDSGSQGGAAVIELQLIPTSSCTGGRIGLDSGININATTSDFSVGFNPSYAAAQLSCFASVNLGGSLGNEWGSIYGSNPNVGLLSAATHYANVVGEEVDITMNAGTSAVRKAGIQIVQGTGDAVQGSTIDAGLLFANADSTVGWLRAIEFRNFDPSAKTVSSGGTFIAATGTTHVAANGIDLSAATFSDSFLKGPNFSVAGNGSAVHIAAATAPPAGGTAGVGYLMSSSANLGVFFGAGAPTLSAAQGSLYLRTDGSSTSTRMYVNTNGSTGWTNVTTAT